MIDRVRALRIALQRPSREALLAGPAVGGLLVAYVGIGWCFLVDVAGLLGASSLYLRMRSYPHRAETTPPSLAGIREGMVYAFRRRNLLGTYIAAAAYGAMIALAGLMPSVWLVALFLALAGAADMVSGIFRSTVWSQTIPESMRGRLAGIEMLSYSVGPLSGQVRAGVTADLWSVRGAITSGGLACVVGVGATALWLRDFWTYDARTDEHAVAERAVRQAAGES